MKVLILSTVHRWNDPRVFHKQAVTLAREHEVILAAVDDGPARTVQGVELRPLGAWKSRWDRPRLWWRAYREILRSAADVIHFHDPELALLLLPCAFLGNRLLVCDVHEHPSAAIRGREWIPRPLRRLAAGAFSRLLRWSPYIYDQVILAEESYVPLFPRRPNVHLVRNYARIPHPDVPFTDHYADFNPRRELRLVCVGSLTRDRGALVMLEAAARLSRTYPGLQLDLVGKVRPPELEAQMQAAARESGGRFRLHGYLDLTRLGELLSQAHLGLVPLQPHPNFLESLSTKFFDYMTYGLPVLASDFPLWRRFFADHPAGITVDPTRPETLAQAIADLVQTPDRLRHFSREGYRLVRERFSWESQAQILLSIYRGLGGSPLPE